MHVVHCVRDLAPESGGPSRSVPALAAALSEQLSKQGMNDVIVPSNSLLYGIASKENNEHPRSEEWGIHFPTRRKGFLGFSGFAARLNAIHANHPIDLVHLHGLWTPWLMNLGSVAASQDIPVVISPRGMLSPWALQHRGLRKKLAMMTYQHRALAAAHVLHATSVKEADEISAVIPNAKIEMVPNGCIDASQRRQRRQGPEDSSCNPIKRAISIGRLHAVKQYDVLLVAWAKAKPQDWRLDIYGPDEDGHRQILEGIVDRLDLGESVSIQGPVEQQRRDELLGQSDLFVMPSATENFGMAIAEAMAAGLPVLTTTGTPWEEVITKDCGWQCGTSQESIQESLRQALQSSHDQLKAMGERGRQWMYSDYTWGAVAERMINVYRKVIER